MKFRFIAPLLAATLALTTITANPAAALDRDQRNQLLLGLGALAIIGAAISHDNQQRDHYRRPPPVTRRYPVPEPWHRDDRYRHDRYSGRYLPQSCEFRANTPWGYRSVMGQHCLRDRNIAVNRLPGRCAFDLRTSQGRRTVYTTSCLTGQGYRVEARR